MGMFRTIHWNMSNIKGTIPSLPSVAINYLYLLGCGWSFMSPPSFLLEFWLLGSCTGLMHSTTLTLSSCVSIPEIIASRSSTTFGSYSILRVFEWFKLGHLCLHDSHFTAAMIPQTSILSFVHYYIRKTGIKSLPNTRINVQCEESDEHIIGTHWLTAYYGVRGRIALEKKNGQQEAYAEK